MEYSKQEKINISLKRSNENLDYDDITDDDLKHVGNEIEKYLNLFLNVLVVPDVLKPNKKELKENIKIVKDLIKRLKKGDRSVFKEDI